MDKILQIDFLQSNDFFMDSTELQNPENGAFLLITVTVKDALLMIKRKIKLS